MYKLCVDTLLITQLILFHWVETKRIQDFKNPGSQGDGSFFGVTTEFKGKEVGYPGEVTDQVCLKL
jgi:light-harvesting complex I chlorophyll a/b binding protein 5